MLLQLALVVAMVTGVHMVEAYLLNPVRLLSLCYVVLVQHCKEAECCPVFNACWPCIAVP